MKKKLALLLVSSLLAAWAPGCTLPGTGDSDAPAADKEVRLYTASPFGGTDASAEDYQELIQAFQEKYPYIRVSDESSISDENWKEKIIADFAAGNEPDVLFFFIGADMRNIIASQKVVPLDTIRIQYPSYGENIKENVLEQMRERDGKIYALPVRGIWEGLFCNRDLFDQYSLALPTDWDSFMAAVEGFAQTGITPIAVSFSDIPHYLIEHLILAAGGVREHQFVPQAGIGIAQYPKSWFVGLSTLKTLRDMGAFAPDADSSTNDAMEQLFFEKRAAMMVSGSWYVRAIPDQYHTTVLPFPPMAESPMKRGDIISGFSMGFYITRKAWDNPAKRDAAVHFVQEMTSNESVAKFAGVAGMPVADIPIPTGLTSLQLDGMQLVLSAKNTDMPIDSRLTKLAWYKLYSSAGDIAKGALSAEEVLNEVAQRNG